MSPVVQAKINGVRYCGKRLDKALKDAIRPVQTNSGRYACPVDYEACNEDFFDAGGHDFVICYPRSSSRDKSCPITDIAFEVGQDRADLYTFIENPGWQPDTIQPKGIYVSKKVMNHGIQTVSVSSERPCHSPTDFNVNSHSVLSPAELRFSQNGECLKPGDNF